MSNIIISVGKQLFIVSLCNQSKCGEKQTRKTPNTDTFHVVYSLLDSHDSCVEIARNRFFCLYFPSVHVNVKNKYLYSVRMRENADQKNSELGYLPCSGGVSFRRKSLSEIDGWV